MIQDSGHQPKRRTKAKKGPKTVPAHKPPPSASSGPGHPTQMPVVISASSSAAGPPGKSGRLASCCFPGEEEKGIKHREQVVNQKTWGSQGREAHHWLAGVCSSGRGAQNIQLHSGWAKPRPSALARAVGGEMAPHSQASKCVCVCVCVCVG
ncbi:unnamed protein product [Rangifer tarandus platyrhynchus]|uniref:Uncharacterized protein n=1 Tax=Rangifer tarandus platyrhynchus TaxID=3082113 RepID=A0AC59ZS84_RANTA